MRPHRPVLIAVLLLGVLSAFVEAGMLYMFGPLVATLTQPLTPADFTARLASLLLGSAEQKFRVIVIAGIIFILVVVKDLLALAAIATRGKVTGIVGHEVRRQMFSQLLTVNHSFWQRTGTGKLFETIATESWRVTDAISISLSLAGNGAIAGVLVLALILLSWRLTFFVGAGVVIFSLLLRILDHHARKLGEQSVSAGATLGQRIWDSAAGIRVIHAFGLHTRKQNEFDQESNEVRRAAMRVELLAAASHPLSEVLHLGLLLTTLVLATQDGTPLPSVVVFLLVLFRLQPFVNRVNQERVQLAGLLSAVDTVSRLLDRGDKPYVQDGTHPFGRLKSEIRLDRVSYRYDEEAPYAVRQISAKIPKGKVTAIVGPSGSGKTTLINLIVRFFDPSEGEIYVDGQPLRTKRLADWRSCIALTGQDMHLFNTSVRENIAYGRLEASDNDIIQAAQDACAHEFIMKLPDGYETELGDQGTRLSSGQRQRIALARAFLRRPDVLLLDEATNALDSMTEQAISRTLDVLSPGRAVVIVAHRLATILKADYVIVLRDGCIVEEGPPTQLLASSKVFAEMCSLQGLQAPDSIST